jgi:thiosulfate/3-mercaptopyruvate sulfurtransferase
MSFKTLISTAALAARLQDPALAVVDCRFMLNDVGWGAREYQTAHVPGAVYADLDRDLSGAKNGRNGRHPLPDPAALTATFGRLGISDGVQVVAYDQNTGAYASRLWWLLRWLGHDAVAVLDGGFAKWTAEGRPTAVGEERRAPARFAAAMRPAMAVGAAEVDRARRDPDWRLLDARAPERYRGEQEPIDPVAGHIPGAVNYFHCNAVSAAGTLKKPEELRQEVAPLVNGTRTGQIVAYCGSGVTACHLLLALEHAGIDGKLYPGSWSEWIADPSRPVEKADAP